MSNPDPGQPVHLPAPRPSRQSSADLFTLPPQQAELVDELLANEQWLADIGAREILTALMSADSADIARGARRLRLAFARAEEHAARVAADQTARELEERHASARRRAWLRESLLAVAALLGLGWGLGVSIFTLF